MAHRPLAILVDSENPQLAIDRSIPIAESRSAPARVVTTTAHSLATAPAAIARVPKHRLLLR
jgi:hypothetical protein